MVPSSIPICWWKTCFCFSACIRCGCSRFSSGCWGGKAQFKRRLADAVLPSVDDLPYNKPLLAWLRQQREAGFKLVLATASDIRIARAVADHLGIFDEVMGTESQNLSSHRKQAALIERFGEKGYAYIGNSSADLPVWRSATAIHVANPERGVLVLGKQFFIVASKPA